MSAAERLLQIPRRFLQIASAGPLFREIGTHLLPHLLTTDLVETIEQAERIAAVDVLRVPPRPEWRSGRDAVDQPQVSHTPVYGIA
ncbi:MAG: hypothetical protein L0G94_12165 [Brachybacterium sp.]|uniref:hypothetical protein n=1 Tax=Brachybacterium sp. TaxID=1891286 RepID=UPI0026476722|nr:hypothetical protein [Brachybacterium sp.]MDN5687409.1 hypothetical protein [Brachybacterium sp.]